MQHTREKDARLGDHAALIPNGKLRNFLHWIFFFACSLVYFAMNVILKVSAVELKLEQMANEAERHARRSSFSQSIQEAKRRAERVALPPPTITTGGRRRSRMKRRGR